jgi:acetylornithine deacetylase
MVGVVHGALGKKLEEWRPVKLQTFASLQEVQDTYAPRQAQKGVLQDNEEVIARVLFDKFPGVKFELKQRFEPTMPAFEVSPDSRIVKSLNTAYRGSEVKNNLLGY